MQQQKENLKKMMWLSSYLSIHRNNSAWGRPTQNMKKKVNIRYSKINWEAGYEITQSHHGKGSESLSLGDEL